MMGQTAACWSSGNSMPTKYEHDFALYPRCSLFHSLCLRQVRPGKLHAYPQSGQWSSDGGNSRSGVLMVENGGTPSPPLTTSFTRSRANGHLLVVADEEGYVNIFNTRLRMPTAFDCERSSEIVRSVQWLAHSNAIFDACWFKEDTQMLTASGDQTIKLWDVETREEVGVMKGHMGSVKAICPHPFEPDIFVSGARDGCVAFWDTRTPAESPSLLDEVSYDPVAKVCDAHKGLTARSRRRGGYTRSVTAVLYLKDGRMVATAGANDGIVKYWDSRKLKAPIASTPPGGVDPTVPMRNQRHGVAGLSLDPSGTRLIATCVDSKIYMYDVTRPDKGVLKAFSGHIVGSFYIKAAFSPDGSHILCGSTDHNAYIWKVDAPDNNPTVLQGHNQEVTAVAWCPTDISKIATCSDDYTVRVWSLRQPRFARTVPHPMVSLSPVVLESNEPMSPCAHVRIETGERVETTNSMELGLKRGVSLAETTPPAKIRKELQFSSLGALHEPVEAGQESPIALPARSPSSVLSPPGSISSRRKTIVDYFGLKTLSTEAYNLHRREE